MFNVAIQILSIYCIDILTGFPVAQLVEHGVSNAKIMGSIPRESKSWQNVETVTWMQCKSLWIKASGKCKLLKVNKQTVVKNILINQLKT